MTLASLLDDLDQRLAESCLGSALKRNHSLAPLTTYRVGGSARLHVTVASLSELEALAAIVAEVSHSGFDVPLLVVGRGSNLLVADRGFAGLAVTLGPQFEHFEINHSKVNAFGSALLPVIARTTVEAGLSGFEWAVGVPGSVGGAVRMNAGGHGADFSQSLTEAVIVDLRRAVIEVCSVSQLQLGYRSSSISQHQVVASVKLKLRFGDRQVSRNELAEIVRWRRANQPGGRNAGSVFTNPENVSAGELIESAGAKRLRIGSAEVSDKHANFIQCDEGGCASDVVAVMREVRRMVKETHGVDLLLENRLVGFESEELP